MTEVLVVLTITAILIVPLLTILRTTNRFDDSQVSAIDARAELDWALTLIANDIRAGTPTARPRVGAAMATTLPVSIVDDSGDAAIVHWRVGDNGLERITYDATNFRELTHAVMVAAVMADEATVPFTYHDLDGDLLDPTKVGADTVVDCTTLIDITLAAETSDDPVTVSLSVALRSRSLGAGAC